jgi:hypothetical protein
MTNLQVEHAWRRSFRDVLAVGDLEQSCNIERVSCYPSHEALSKEPSRNRTIELEEVVVARLGCELLAVYDSLLEFWAQRHS